MQLSRPSKILFAIARGDAFGGSSLHIMDLASRLESEGHTVRVIVGGNPDMEVPRRFAGRNLDFSCIPELGRAIHLVKDLKAAAAIRREVKRFSPDLISLHSSKAGAVGRIGLIGTSTPKIYTPHCWAFVDGFPKARLYRYTEKLLAPMCTRIIAVSEDERQFGLKHGVGKKAQVITIHNGVHDVESSSFPTTCDPLDRIRIIMVGRFEEQKNHALLLRALANLRKLNWDLTLIGEGPLLTNCKTLAEELGLADRIDFAGYSTRVTEELGKHDLFALISNWEGFPRSILEATSLGLPVITSDVGGCRESVIDGKTGRVVPPNNLDSLTDALRDLISNPAELVQMGQAGRDRFERLFTFETMYSKYEQLYCDLIQGIRPATTTPHRENLETSPPLQHSAKSPAKSQG